MSRNALNKFRKDYPDTIWTVTPEQKARLEVFFGEELRYASEEDVLSPSPRVHLPRLSSQAKRRAALYDLRDFARQQFIAETATKKEGE